MLDLELSCGELERFLDRSLAVPSPFQQQGGAGPST